MRVTEREKGMIRSALERGALTIKDLEYAEYSRKEIEYILSDKEWRILYSNIDDQATVKICQSAVAEVLGEGWRNVFDYSEGRKNGKFELMIFIEKERFDAICEKAKELRI